VALGAGGTDGVSFSIADSNTARFVIPGGIEVDVKVSGWKTWLVCAIKSRS
jgi:hypothetical protein